MEPGDNELPSTASAEIDVGDYFLDDNEFEIKESAPFPEHSVPFVSPDQNHSSNFDPSSFSGVHPDVIFPEDSELFSEIALKDIGELLLKEDYDVPSSLNEDSLALQAAEKPFYEILGEKYPPSTDELSLHVNVDPEGQDAHSVNGGCENHICGSSNGDRCTICDSGDHSSFQNMHYPTRVVDGLEDFPINTVMAPEIQDNSLTFWQHFQSGFEEASKLMPNFDSLALNSEKARLLSLQPKETGDGGSEAEKKNRIDHSDGESRGRKNTHSDDREFEGERSKKQSAVFTDQTVGSEMFDLVLLCGPDKCEKELSTIQETFQNGVIQNKPTERSKRDRRSRGKRQVKREVVDFGALLSQCAQAVSSNDHRTGSELLKQIREHSSPFGDGMQRLAHYFADALEARLAGTGNEVYKELTKKKLTDADLMKAYHLYMVACPFKMVSFFFANQSILDTVGDAPRVHVVVFGIGHGLQWPSFFKRLASRSCGPPLVRMTAIDFPQPGFRPADKVEATGRRLSDYAQRFNIPFEYVPIVCSNWETIRVEDLKTQCGEVLIVNACYHLDNLADETTTDYSPRDIVLKTIREINPDIFILVSPSGGYNAPFFIPRFREALFQFSALFDIFEVNVAREQPERVMFEGLYGQYILNVIACEGEGRIERPETYKSWRLRMIRAGFLQLPLNQDIVKKSRDKVQACYHKEFIIFEDNHFLLQGWKGRIVGAASAWKPDNGRY